MINYIIKKVTGVRSCLFRKEDAMKKIFNEDTRVKIPATIQFLRIGYNYQSLSDVSIDFETKIFVNRF